MIETVEQLKKERPDLVELYESMDRDQLLNQIYLEAIDAINMEKRVQEFMEECTIGMSKTTYSIETIRGMINEREEQIINEFCFLETYDDPTDEELINVIKERASRCELV